MSDNKDAEPSAGEEVSSLERAMQDAVEAVEAHEAPGAASSAPPEGEEDADEIELEVETEADTTVSEPAESGAPPKKSAPPKNAQDAVMESMIAAKKELEQVLEQTREETKKLRDKWLRAAADLQNYKKRSAREREDAVKFGNERILKDLLPVLDDLDLTLHAMETAAADAPVSSLLDGVRMVHKKFLSQLEKNGVTSFDSEGEGFDPGKHEAVQQVHSDEVDAGGVASQIRRGFFLNERLLRPAMVSVSLGKQPEEDTSESEE